LPESRIGAEVLSETSRAGADDISIQIKRTEPLSPFAPFEQPLRGKDLTEALRIQRLIARETGSEPYFGGFSILTRVRASTATLLDKETVVDRVRLSKSNARMTTLTNAVALSGASPALFSPSLGAGDEVMIIEGSFDPSHPALAANRIVEHCFGVAGSSSLVQCTVGTGNAGDRHGVGAAKMSDLVPRQNLQPPQPLETSADFHGIKVSSIVGAVNAPLPLVGPLYCPYRQFLHMSSAR